MSNPRLLLPTVFTGAGVYIVTTCPLFCEPSLQTPTVIPPLLAIRTCISPEESLPGYSHQHGIHHPPTRAASTRAKPASYILRCTGL